MSDPIQPAASQPEPPYAPPAPGAQPEYGAAPQYGVPPYGVPPYAQPVYPGAGAQVRPLRGIGAATRWLIVGYAVLSSVTILLNAWGIVMLNAYSARSAGIDALEAYDSNSARLSIVSLIVL